MARARSRAAIAAATGFALAVTGCSAWSDESAPEEAARTLAKGLSTGELDGVAFTAPGKQDESARPDDSGQRDASAGRERTRSWWKDITEELDPARPRVRLDTVTEPDGDTAEAKLRYSWSFPGHEEPWEYTTTAELVRTDDAWAVRPDRSLLRPSLRADESLDLVERAPERGDILGAGNRALVTRRPVFRFGIDKTKVDADQQPDSARELARLLEIDAESYVERVRDAGDRAFVEAIVYRTGDVSPDVEAGTSAIEGAVALSDEIPLAPSRAFARPLLGTVGPVTAEILEENPDKYDVGDQVGLSGLQQRYDDRLRGRPGFEVRARNDETGTTRTLFTIEPGDGRPLRTTLDEDLQTAAERALADADAGGALVAIRPSDGNVLAAASGPGSGSFSVATTGRVPPGSTFKVVTALALLRSGATPETTMPCPESTTVNGKHFENYDGYPSSRTGNIPLSTAFAESCNTSFILQRDRTPPSALREAAAALGLGVDTDLGAPAYLGSVPSSAPETGRAAATIGQGKVLASPLAMATVAASVADGQRVVPRLLPEHDPGAGDGAGSGDDAGTAGSAEPLTPDEARQLRTLMRGVVTDGAGAALADVPGEDVLAKTGTAEFEQDGEIRTHAWMLGIQGDLAVAAFVEGGDSGSGVAGPVLESFLRDAAA